jgi:hypothetical protein
MLILNFFCENSPRIIAALKQFWNRGPRLLFANLYPIYTRILLDCRTPPWSLILRNEFISTQEVARQNIQVSFYIRSTGLWSNTWIHVPQSLAIIRNAIHILWPPAFHFLFQELFTLIYWRIKYLKLKYGLSLLKIHEKYKKYIFRIIFYISLIKNDKQTKKGKD